MKGVTSVGVLRRNKGADILGEHEGECDIFHAWRTDFEGTKDVWLAKTAME